MYPFTLQINEGLSSGMTITWLKKSIASNGRGIFHSRELGPQHFMAIAQGACAWRSTHGGRKADLVDMLISLIQSQNLIPCKGLCGRGFALFPPEQIVNWALSRPGYSLFFFEKKEEITKITEAKKLPDAGDASDRVVGSSPFFGATSLGAFGHMLGIRCEGRTLQMFDADQGLFEYTNVSSFKQHMKSYFSTTPPTPRDIKWDWGIMSVKDENPSTGLLNSSIGIRV